MANMFFGATYTQMVGQFNNDFLKLYQPILQNIHLQIEFSMIAVLGTRNNSALGSYYNTVSGPIKTDSFSTFP